MELLVIGSTGGTGRRLVEQALGLGYGVTAFVRDPAKLGIEHAGLRVVRGDVMDPSSVGKAVRGRDAVLSALGAPASQRRDTVRSEGTRNVIGAMEEAGVRRFVCMTTLGMGDSRGALPFRYKYVIVPLILRHAFADSELQEDRIKRSRLDWTIVRPAALTDGERTGAYRHGFPATEKGLKIKISRADVADFMLRQLADGTYLRKTPGVSY